MNNLLAYIPPKSFDVVEIFGNILTEWYLYAVLLAVLAIFFAITIIFKPNYVYKTTNTKKLASIAVLTAFCVGMNALCAGTIDAKLSLVPTAGFIAGVMLGPINGFLVGLVGDLIAAIIAPTGIYNPLIALASGLWGFFPGIFLCYTKKRPYLNASISYVICVLLCSIVINTIACYYMYYSSGKTYATVFIYFTTVRVPSTLINLLINVPISLYLIKPLNALKDRSLTSKI